MALINTDSGCKVGWETYDDEEEAKARAEKAREQAVDMARRGYDFGFQVPGEVVRRREYTEEHPEGVWVDEWVVTIP